MGGPGRADRENELQFQEEEKYLLIMLFAKNEDRHIILCLKKYYILISENLKGIKITLMRIIARMKHFNDVCICLRVCV